MAQERKKRLEEKMSKHRVSVWVAPEFRKLLKKEAADANKDMISFTDYLAKKHDQQNKREKKNYEFF